jgi:hypothetical protein
LQALKQFSRLALRRGVMVPGKSPMRLWSEDNIQAFVWEGGKKG